MIDVNGLGGFDKRISFSTKRVVFDNDKLTIAKNIKKISNTTTKFNFVKKVFNAMKKFSTLLMMSQSGRMGIENRKENVVKYTDKVNILNSRFNECFKLQNENSKELKNKGNELDLLKINREELKVILLNNDVFNDFINKEQELELIINNPKELNKLINNNESLKNEIDSNEKLGTVINEFLNSDRIEIEKYLQSALELKNKLLVEEKKVDHFLSLIENENVNLKDRYSFFNYLNELKRAESFCRQSSNPSDEQLADVFKSIFEERISRVKERDVKKIYSEVIDTYRYETFFLKENKSTLANFSSNKEKEKFLSKINFLVTVSESSLDILNNLFDKNIADKLHDIMHTILNEEYHDSGVNISYRDTKDTWIKEYMNEFYGSEKKITTQNVGINTDSSIEIQNRNNDTASVGSSGYRADVSDNVSDSISDIISTISDDTASVRSSGYRADISLNGSELIKKEYISSIDELDSILETEYSNLFTNSASAIKENNMQEAIRNIMFKLYDLSSIVTESLASPQSENKSLIISLEKITSMSNIIHSVQEVLNNIDPNYSLELNENIYNKFKESIENIAIEFEIIGDKIESFNEDNTASIEIEKLLNDILNKISYTNILERKNWLDKIQVSINDVINRYRLTDKDNYSINNLESDADFLNQETLFSDPLSYNDELLIPFDFSSTESIMNNIKSILKRNEGDYSYNEKKEPMHEVEHDQNEVIKENESGRDEVGEFKNEIKDIDELIKTSSKRKDLLEKISDIDSEIKNNLKK